MLLKVTGPDGSEVTSITGLTRKTSGGVTGFDIKTQTGLVTIADNYTITSTGTAEQEWNIEIIFANLDTDQQGNTGKIFSASLIIQEETITTSLGNFAEYITTQLYTGTDGENGLYYHDGVGSYTSADQEAGDYSYRYAGANPNNYVCFGSVINPCLDECLYRIIGVFNEQVKLIKADYTNNSMLGLDGGYEGNAGGASDGSYQGNISEVDSYMWANDNINNWTTGELNKINLNTNYWNYLGTTWQNLISEHTWHLGGIDDYIYTAKSFYDGERNNIVYESNPITYTDEIGLMYPSDYSYAASPANWNTWLGDYDNATNRDNNWMFMGLSEWTITPVSTDQSIVFIVESSGSLDLDSAFFDNSARPVFYLNSNVELSGGTGTSTDPFILNLG